MILRPVPSFSQSLSSFEFTATHFSSNLIFIKWHFPLQWDLVPPSSGIDKMRGYQLTIVSSDVGIGAIKLLFLRRDQGYNFHFATHSISGQRVPSIQDPFIGIWAGVDISPAIG